MKHYEYLDLKKMDKHLYFMAKQYNIYKDNGE